MADYISCIEASGGNRDEIVRFLENETQRSGEGAAEGAGSGVVVSGSGSVEVDISQEKRVIRRIETRWFPQSMSHCASALDANRRQAAEEHLKSIAESAEIVADNTPSRAHPVVDLSRDLKTQIQLFATDEVTIVGSSDIPPISEVKLGQNRVKLNGGGQGEGRFTVWAVSREPIVPEFLDVDGKPIRTGTLKLLVEYRVRRGVPRDL